MKNLIKLAVSLLAAFGISAAASAAVITSGPSTGADVGGVDSFIRATQLGNSSPETETAWVTTQIPGSAVFISKTENVDYFSTNLDDVYAFALTGSPGYFLIKNATWWALFENVASLNWAVFLATELPSGMNIPSSTWTISHVSVFNPRTDVPTPGTLALLALGLLGFGFIGRRRA